MSARPPGPSGTGLGRRRRPRTRPPARVPMTLAVLPVLLLLGCLLAPAARACDPSRQTETPVMQVASTDVSLTIVPVVDLPLGVVRVADAPPGVVPVVVIPPVVVVVDVPPVVVVGAPAVAPAVDGGRSVPLLRV
jgi:hypothetical protein